MASYTIGLLQLSNHVVQIRQTGEQMTHRDMLKKASKFEFSFFNVSQCVISLQFGDFVPRGRSAANGPSFRSVTALSSIKRHVSFLPAFETSKLWISISRMRGSGIPISNFQRVTSLLQHRPLNLLPTRQSLFLCCYH